MNMIELKTMKELHQRELARLNGITVQCGSCEEWRNQRCNKFDSVPPAEVKAAGCGEWAYDFIPF